jgi:murein DD-endopeptidase MepM/ murein hydrolase activator NlpD
MSTRYVSAIALLVLFACRPTGAQANPLDYFTQPEAPVLEVTEIDQQKPYTETLTGHIAAKSSGKIKTIKGFLDNKESFRRTLNTERCGFKFMVSIKKLCNGPHTLRIEATDSSYFAKKTTQEITFSVDKNPWSVSLTKDHFEVAQGRTLHVKLEATHHLEKPYLIFCNQKLALHQDPANGQLYEAFIPIAMDHKPCCIPFKVHFNDRNNMQQSLSAHATVKPYTFKRGKGLTFKKKSQGKRRRKQRRNRGRGDANCVGKILGYSVASSPKHKLWQGPFQIPIEARYITSPFGEIRAARRHNGVDIVDTLLCPIKAAHHGKIIIKKRFPGSGNTVVLDHGLSVFTIYAHMHDFANIKIGDRVSQGDKLGRMGGTGTHASGPHLHWELRVGVANQRPVPVDPFEWTQSVY